ncbi:MAG: ROK family protein [Anaerolineae bacterium]|nr:ROK family protein [Anaerolineae bacterium]
MDIRRTSIRVTIFPENGNPPLTLKKIPTRGQEIRPEHAVGSISELWPQEHTVFAIGITAPGLLYPPSGIVYAASHYLEWRNFPLKPIVSKNFGVPVSIESDANMVALGEWKFGTGQGDHGILYLAISTGIGKGIILDDRVVLDWRGLAGELGYVTVDRNIPFYSSGQKGHLEAMASRPANSPYGSTQIANGCSSLVTSSPPPTAKEIVQVASEGNRLAIEPFTKADKFNGKTLTDFLHVFNPSIILLGGRGSFSGQLFAEPMRVAFYQHIISPQYTHNLRITTAALADNAGLSSALRLARPDTPPG